MLSIRQDSIESALLVFLYVGLTKGFFRFSFNKKSPEDATWKTEFFLQTLFLENQVQINKNNYGTMFFMSEQVSLPKNKLDPAKNETSDIRLFLVPKSASVRLD